ncbi:MAG TPA: kelch repeat-containing protein [Candidatus Acidoferrales bacterium]
MFDHFRKGRKWFLVIVAGAVGTFTAVQAGYAQGGTWTPLAPVSPSPTEGMTVGGVGQVIVGAYGFSGGAYTNQTRLYNINTDTWSLGGAAPTPARAGAASGDTTHGGFLYVIGGENSTGVLADLQRYDPVTDMWTPLMPMTTARAGAAAAVIDDGIFVIGGRKSTNGPCSGGPYLQTVEKYDIDTDTWSPVAQLPSARSDLAAVAHGGKIFVFGGCDSTGVTDEVDMYDPQTNTWTTGLTPMLTKRASLVAGHSGDNVYAIGGTNGVLASNANEVYDVAHNTWSNNMLMTTARQEAGVNSHGGRIYVVGGSTTFGTSTPANEVFKP